MEFNEQEAQRVVQTAQNVIKIVKAIKNNKTANEIVQEVGCNYSVAKYYIKLLTHKK